MLYIYHNPWLILQLETLFLNPLHLSHPPHSLPLCQPAFFFPIPISLFSFYLLILFFRYSLIWFQLCCVYWNWFCGLTCYLSWRMFPVNFKKKRFFSAGLDKMFSIYLLNSSSLICHLSKGSVSLQIFCHWCKWGVKGPCNSYANVSWFPY